MRRLTAVGLLALTICGMGVVQARADGDPGSDVLVYQPLFVAPDAGTTVPEQLQLTSMLRKASDDGVPIRIAVISHRADLGAITGLWRKPQAYARFLGIELSLSYKGRLIVVMPNGFGFNWPGHATGAIEQTLDSIAIQPGGVGIVTAAEAGTARLAAAANVKLPIPALSRGGAASAASHHASTNPTIVGAAPAAHSSARQPGSAGSTGQAIAAGAALVLAVLALTLLFGGGGRRRVASIYARAAAASRRLLRIRGRKISFALGLGVVLCAIGVGGVLTDSSGSADSALETNPYLDPGTALGGRPAPNFTLYGQTGDRVSLKSFRGKVTLLAFNDSECTTICPLTTEAMLDAKRMLGSAGRNVQLLGVNANPKAIQIEDVLSYTQLHGLVGKWDFLTGSLSQLREVWRAYGVEAAITGGLISHTPALYVIDQRGRLRKLYMTQQNYASVAQFGQILAHEISSLLPSHPGVLSHLSYRAPASTPPTRRARLPRVGGGSVTVGPGKPRLYLFFDTWDREVSSLAGELDGLNAYATEAAKYDLPSLTAVDEGSVEPSARALPSFLKQLPSSLRYPVAIDTTGRVADGYEVQGVPWLVLTSARGKIIWYDEVLDANWPTVADVEGEVRAALSKRSAQGGSASSTSEELIGSPPRLAALHRQAGRLLGGVNSLMARIKALRGYPIVVNIWASWCTACTAEFGLLAKASAQYGRQVAFLGANTDDSSADAAQFLREHHVSYPSYTDRESELSTLIRGGLAGYPTTVYVSRTGKVVDVHLGEYESQGILDSDIKTYALSSR
jgi:cytochrome oxidase Cu insertion factor (SCO1/SenC/PrrC family)/thiol-disulfide isomerase/thioredoxin